MGNLLLATEAHSSGFGLNFNIFETNLINLTLLVGILVYFGRDFLGNVLRSRRSRIEEAITEAEAKQRKAAEALADQQQKLAQAQAEAERIRKAAQENAQAAKEVIAAQNSQDIQRLKETAAQDLNSEQEQAIAELKQRIAALALQQVETQLKESLNESDQQALIDRSIAQLGGEG